jgi:hypothetical protein
VSGLNRVIAVFKHPAHLSAIANPSDLVKGEYVLYTILDPSTEATDQLGCRLIILLVPPTRLLDMLLPPFGRKELHSLDLALLLQGYDLYTAEHLQQLCEALFCQPHKFVLTTKSNNQ